MANKIQIDVTANDKASAVLAQTAQASKNLTASLSMFAMQAGPIVGAITAVTVGAAKMALSFANDVEQLQNLSKRTGTSINEIRVLQRAFKEQGLSAEMAGTALTFLSRSIGRNDPLLGALGIKTRDTNKALLQLADAFSSSSDEGAKNEIAFKLLGRGGAEASIMLEGLRSKVAELTSTMYQLTPANIASAEFLDRRADEFGRMLDNYLTRAKATAAEIAFYWDIIFGRPGPNRGARLIPGIEVSATRKSGEDPLALALRMIQQSQTPKARVFNSVSESEFLGPPTPQEYEKQRWARIMSAEQRLGPVNVPDLRHTQGGKEAEERLNRIQRMTDSFSYGVSNSFQNMFSRVLSIQTRSNNVITNLFVDLANSIVRAVTDEVSGSVGSSIGRFIVGLIPGVGAAASAASGTNVYVSTLSPSSLVGEIASPTGSLRQANVRLREVAAVS